MKADRDVKAELVFALEHRRAVWGDPNATLDDVAGADDWVTAVRPAAQRAAAELAKAETAHQAHREWKSATAGDPGGGRGSPQESWRSALARRRLRRRIWLGCQPRGWPTRRSRRSGPWRRRNGLSVRPAKRFGGSRIELRGAPAQATRPG